MALCLEVDFKEAVHPRSVHQATLVSLVLYVQTTLNSISQAIYACPLLQYAQVGS